MPPKKAAAPAKAPAATKTATPAAAAATGATAIELPGTEPNSLLNAAVPDEFGQALEHVFGTKMQCSYKS